MSTIHKGDQVLIKNNVQYYDNNQQTIITDSEYAGLPGIVKATNYIGSLALVKLSDREVLVHPINLTKNNDSADVDWLAAGSLVRIIGPVCSRLTGYYGKYYTSNGRTPWGRMGCPGANSTTRYKGKLADVGRVVKTNDQQTYVELKIRGPKGGLYYAVAWASSLKQEFI